MNTPLWNHIAGVVCPPETNCDAVRCQLDRAKREDETLANDVTSHKIELEEEEEGVEGTIEGASRKFPEKCSECGAGWLSRQIPWEHKNTCSKYPGGITTASDPDDIDDGDIDDDDDIEDDDDFDDEDWDIEEGDDELDDEENDE